MLFFCSGNERSLTGYVRSRTGTSKKRAFGAEIAGALLRLCLAGECLKTLYKFCGYGIIETMETWSGTLSLIGTGENEVSLQTECRVTTEDGQWTVLFDETVTGMDGTDSCLVLSEDALTLTRMGAYGTCLVFERDREMPVTLGSPFGELSFVLRTHRLDVVRSARGFVADVEYVFRAGDEVSLKNGLHVVCDFGRNGSGDEEEE